MATTIVTFLRQYDTALTAKLTSVGGTGTPNASGYACTNTNGLQSLTITESLVGEFYLYAYDSLGDIAYHGYVVLADDTGTYRVEDTVAAIKADADLGTAGLVANAQLAAEQTDPTALLDSLGLESPNLAQLVNSMIGTNTVVNNLDGTFDITVRNGDNTANLVTFRYDPITGNKTVIS